MAFWNKNNNKINTRSHASSNRQTPKNRAVFSYYQNRDTDDMIRDKKRSRMRDFVAHVPTFIAVIAMCLSVIYAVSLSSDPSIVLVNEQNNSSGTSYLRTKNVYTIAAKKLFQQSVLNQNKITVNTDDIAQNMQSQFSEITDVSVVLPIISRNPVVYIRIAEPALVLRGSQGSFVIDEKGRAILGAAQLSKEAQANLLPVDDKAGLAITVGSQALPQANVKFVQTVKNQLSAQSIAVSRMELPPLANELHVYLAKQPYYVKFSLSGDALQQTGTFIGTKLELDKKHIVPGQYIDVRVEERAYYL